MAYMKVNSSGRDSVFSSAVYCESAVTPEKLIVSLLIKALSAR